LRRQGVMPIGLQGVETPKSRNLSMLSQFGVSHFGTSRLAKTRGPALWSSGCRNAEKPKPIHAKPIRSFALRDFVTCEDKGSCPLVFRCRNTEKPKPIHAKPIRSFTLWDFTRLAKTRGPTLWSSRCRNAEKPKPIHAKPIQSFALQDFATCEDKGSCPLVFRVPKHRKAKTYSC
jgi:hypothetical protein